MMATFQRLRLGSGQSSPCNILGKFCEDMRLRLKLLKFSKVWLTMKQVKSNPASYATDVASQWLEGLPFNGRRLIVKSSNESTNSSKMR